MFYVFIQSLIVWLLLWLVCFGILFSLRKRGIDHIKRFYIIILHFLVFSIISITIFNELISNILSNFTITPFVFLVLLFVFEFLFYYYCNKIFPKPHHLSNKYSDQYFLRIDYRYLLSKPFDILFQQILIVVLVLLLERQGINLFWIVVLFALLFGLIHLPTIKISGNLFGIIYTTASIFSAMLFPILILKVNYGFVYSYISHHLFYMFLGLYFWSTHK